MCGVARGAKNLDLPIFAAETYPVWIFLQRKIRQRPGRALPGAIGSKLNGVCSIHFPKQHRLLRELVKTIMVDDAFACNWLVSGKIWCNVDYDSDIRKPLLTAHPVPFVQSAYEALLSSEHCSAITVMGPDGKEIDVNDVEKLPFDLSRTYHDEEADETSSASTDDLQRDLRCLMRVVRAVATKAGLTDPELDAFMHD